MTARLKALEERYQTRLFNRSTRAIALTRAGEEFYHAALRVQEEMTQAESKLMQKDGLLSGSLRISAPRTLADSIFPLRFSISPVCILKSEAPFISVRAWWI